MITADDHELFACRVHARRVAVSVAAVAVRRRATWGLGGVWHVAPLPPGIPYEEQQLKALMSESGVLDVTPESQTDLAARIRSRLQLS